MTSLKTCANYKAIFYRNSTQENDFAEINEPTREGQRRVANLDYFERGFVQGMTIIRRK